ncbi:MAG: hypothetical protein DWI68_00360 [Chloroflexi bacterium]|nr:MAG: hypothetical protein DWI68_00360 [Chloroflexota bacterium]
MNGDGKKCTPANAGGWGVVTNLRVDEHQLFSKTRHVLRVRAARFGRVTGCAFGILQSRLDELALHR